MELDRTSSECRTLALVASAGALLATTNQGTSIMVATATLLCAYDALKCAYRTCCRWASLCQHQPLPLFPSRPLWQAQGPHEALCWSLHRQHEEYQLFCRRQMRACKSNLGKQRRFMKRRVGALHLKLKRERSAKNRALGKRRANVKQLAALEERIATNMARFERLVETLEAWSSCPQSPWQEEQQLQDASEPWLASRSRDSLPETESIGSQEAASDFTMAPCTPPSRAQLGNGRLSESSPMQKDESFSFGCPQ